MTLTEFAYYLRKYSPLAVLFVIVILIFFLTFKIIEIARPVAPVSVAPTPTPAFGQLPAIAIPNARALPQSMEYVMETLEGVPLTATSSAHIFFVPKQTPNLGFREKANVIAKALQFDAEAMTSRLNPEDETFTLVDRAKRLIVHIDNFNFTYSQELDSTVNDYLASMVMPDEQTIKTKAQDIMRKLNRYPPALAQATHVITYIAYRVDTETGGSVAQIVRSPQEANMVHVDFFPPPIHNIEVVTEDFISSPNRVVFIPQRTSDDFVIKAQVAVNEHSEVQSSVYPLKTGGQVFADLQAGKGLLIQGFDKIGGKKRVGIRKMYLAYLAPSVYAPYLQPIYVFIGDDDFVAYVPAVLDSWTQPLQIPDPISPTNPPERPLTQPPTPTVVEATAEPTAIPTEIQDIPTSVPIPIRR